MEWTWFKDWWRLKKLRSRHQRHKKKLEAAAAAADPLNAADTDALATAQQHVASPAGNEKRRHSLDTHTRRRRRARDRIPRYRLRQRRARSAGANAAAAAGAGPGTVDAGQEAKEELEMEESEEDGEYGPFNVCDYLDYDYRNAASGGDEESDDFCYCDECLNVGVAYRVCVCVCECVCVRLLVRVLATAKIGISR